MIANPNVHPTDDVILRWVIGELVGEDALALEDHMAACSVCGTRLADEAALDVVLYEAGSFAVDLDANPESERIVVRPTRRAPRVARGGWRHGLAAAAGFALLLLGGRDAFDRAHVDAVDTGLGRARVAIADGPASWDRGATPSDSICESPPSDTDGELCAEPVDARLAMALSSEPAPWSDQDEPCTTPVDTGDSLICDDWLSNDDLSG